MVTKFVLGCVTQHPFPRNLARGLVGLWGQPPAPFRRDKMLVKTAETKKPHGEGRSGEREAAAEANNQPSEQSCKLPERARGTRRGKT